MKPNELVINYVNCDAETWCKTIEQPHITKRFIPSSRCMDIDYKLGATTIGSKTSIYTRGRITSITCILFKEEE